MYIQPLEAVVESANIDLDSEVAVAETINGTGTESKGRNTSQTMLNPILRPRTTKETVNAKMGT